MAKKVLVLTLIILLVLSLGVFGGKKPVENKIKPADKGIVSQNLITPEPKVFFPATDDTAGYTYWDAQHDNSMRRQIAKDTSNGGILHFTWMNLVGPDMSNNRYVYYNNYDPSYPAWLVAGGMPITPALGRAGYGGLDLLPDNREVLAYQRDSAYTGENPWYTTISIEETYPGLGEFNSYDIPDSVANRWQGLIRPYVGIAKQGTPTYMHITNFSEYCVGYHPPICSYYAGYVRCYEDGSNVVCQSPNWWPDSSITLYPDTKLKPNRMPYIFPAGDGKLTYSAAPIATSPVSEKITIAWYDEVDSRYKGEIYYVESTNNGTDWMVAGSMGPIYQITNYGANNWQDYWTHFPEIATVYDYDDVLHIIWTTCEPGDIDSRTLWHWSPVSGIREVSTRVVTADCGDSNYAIAKPTVGVGTAFDNGVIIDDSTENYLYVVYTGFSDDDTSAGGFANGDLYKIVSSNGGLTWGPEVNLTNTNSDGCTAGNCQSEHWASIAERVDSFMYVQYIYDKDAGGIPYNEGTFTYNPVRYLKERRQFVPAVALKVFAPTQMISPVKWAQNGGTTQDTLEFDNRGTATLYVQMSGPAYITINPSNFSIAEAGPTQTVDLTFSGAGLQDTLLVDSLMIASNDSLLDGGETYADTEWVKIHFVVTDTFYYAEYDTVSWGVKLAVSNVGNLGNQEEGNMMNYNGYDYLFDFTPVFVTPDLDGYGPKGFTWLHHRHDFLPEGHMEVCDKTSALKASVAYGEFTPINPTLSPPWHHWWSYWTMRSKVINSEYNGIRAVIVYNWWRWNPPPIWWPDITGDSIPTGGYFGIAADWDVPVEGRWKNNGNYDDTLHLIWLKGDTTGYYDYYGGFLFLDATVTKGGDTTYRATAPLGAHVLTNASQLWPFHGYNDDSLHKYMSTSGYSLESNTAQDMNIVMSFIEELNPDSTTEIGLKYALIVTDEGEAQLYDQASKIKCVKCGDANVDCAVSVSDVVYEINYLFKGGPQPWLYFSDVNGDCSESVSDVVYKINYLFKGGPAPRCDCCDL
jgi:hypothetical protein